MKLEYINKIVKASGVTEGELVLVHFWGEDSHKEYANAFVAAVAALGATPVLLQQARSVNAEIFARATESSFGERYFEWLSGFDAVLDVFAYQPVVLKHDIGEEQMGLYRRHMAHMFEALAKAKRLTQIRIPTWENAEEVEMNPEDYISRMERAFDIDYDALQINCMQEKERLKDMQQIVLHTGEDSELFLDLTGREWLLDVGDGDWPCGEIYIAPNEEKTEGSVYFEQLFLGNVGEFSKVTLQVAQGKVVGSNNKRVAEYFQQLEPEERVVCELGLGMNPNVTDVCGYTVLDEKMAKTFHIAVGANNMFGGKNSAFTHMDMVGTEPFRIAEHN